MPNWVDTVINVRSDAETIGMLGKEFDKALMKDGKRNIWLGNLLIYIGEPKEEVEDLENEKYHTRGQVSFINILGDGDEMDIGVTSAWSPHIRCVYDFLSHFADNLDVTYIAHEESGFRWTDDPELVDMVEVMCDCEGVSEDILRLDTEGVPSWRKKDLMNELVKLTGMSEDSTFEELTAGIVSKVREADGRNFVSFWSYEYVPANEMY